MKWYDEPGETWLVDIEPTDEGRNILGHFPGRQAVRYANGPLLGKAKTPDGLGPYTVLANYCSDMAMNLPDDIMHNTPASWSTEFCAS